MVYAWDGATAVLTLSSGSVAAGSVTILEGGSGYTAGELLYFDREVIGGAYSSGVTIQHCINQMQPTIMFR